MSARISRTHLSRAFVLRSAWIGLAVTLAAGQSFAEVKRIVIDKKISPAFDGARFGAIGQYETLTGRAFGEIDPADPHNAIIQDISLAPRNDRGMVEYSATFHLVKPIDMSKASGLLWHDVPNRGVRITLSPDERTLGDVGLSSGWQGDNVGGTSQNGDHDFLIPPVAKNPDETAITGSVMGRIMNASGVNSQPIIVHTSAVPYWPVSLDAAKSRLTTHASETIDGAVTGDAQVADADWAWAKCDSAHPFPGTPDPTQICLRGGFDPSRLYQVVFTAQDPPVLGIGFAAFRDVAAFFKSAPADGQGYGNPLNGRIPYAIVRGVSQSGNFVRAFLHLGFNELESGERVYDGAWPIIAGRRISMNARFAMPDGVLKLYEPGSEGPQWWAPWPDPVRGIPSAGILDRCTKSQTCPKIIEHFGSAEVWALKLTPEWVGAAGDADIPLPANVRRYYIPSSQHGGGIGGFATSGFAPIVCPSVGYGVGVLPANPMPHTQTVNAIRMHFRDWVMRNIEPPPSVYPTLASGNLVDANKKAMGFPTLPGLPANTPDGLINPLLDYDFGPKFNYADGSGVMNVPPAIKRVFAMKAPRVDADGNEVGGVPVVLRDAPLATYLGFNITAAGFNKGKVCNYAGGVIPFARTRAERESKRDPRLSLEERYGTHEGYVRAVEAAAAKAQAAGFLLDRDAKALVAAAAASDVLALSAAASR